MPQCYQKKVAQWQKGNPATRGPRPRDPKNIDLKTSGNDVQKFNDEQFKEFTANLSPCPNCGRTFLPDRLPVHMKGCKASGGPPSGRSQVSNTTVRPTSQAGFNKTNSGGGLKRGPGIRPVLPTCYLCGQQFGTSSIGIHVPQCYQKKYSQWASGDVRTRGNEPKHPDSVNWRGTSGASVQEQAEEQFQEFVNNLEPCPNCARRFLHDRLIVHLRSCRPGNAAKRVQPLAPQEAARPELGASTPSASGEPVLPLTPSTSNNHGLKRKQPSDEPLRLNPRKNRIPLQSDGFKGHTCPSCSAVEYDINAKFCRECGRNLLSKQQPCSKCKELIPLGSRFCGTCGEPVEGSTTGERVPGDDNVNAPTVRMTVCPACKAVCDADGNFCDNCGAALGDSESTLTEEQSRALTTKKIIYMFCTSCNERVNDPAAVFCEECGEKLEQRIDSDKHGRASATLDVKTPTPPTSNAAAAARAVMSATKSQNPTEPPPQNPSSLPRRRPAQEAATPVLDDGEVDHDMERAECPQCGRMFAKDVLIRHSRVCKGESKRAVFNMAKQRLADTGAALPSSAISANTTKAVSAKPTKDWKAESEAFRKAMREARMVDKVIKAGGNARDLPPPTYSVNPNYVLCKYCNRRFAPDVAERHIPRCATTINKPKPPPKHPAVLRR